MGAFWTQLFAVCEWRWALCHTDVKHAWILSRSPASVFSYAARAIPMRALQQVFSREIWEERAGHRVLIRPNLQVKAKWHALVLSFHLSRTPSSLPLVFESLLFCLCGLENIQSPPPPRRHFLSFSCVAKAIWSNH